MSTSRIRPAIFLPISGDGLLLALATLVAAGALIFAMLFVFAFADANGPSAQHISSCVRS